MGSIRNWENRKKKEKSTLTTIKKYNNAAFVRRCKMFKILYARQHAMHDMREKLKISIQI